MTARAPGPGGHAPPGTDTTAGIRAEGLVRSFGARRALDGVDLEVPAGSVLGLLGPNGAGKTTIVKVLTTLLRADAGRAWVDGADVLAEPDEVRRRIGLSGQYAAVDARLTATENLYLVGRLYGMSRRTARTRARDLLDRFRLTEVADERSGSFSGGMRRRLDLAGALVARPSVVVLDEPTTGLDPRGRSDTWTCVRELVADGTTVLLTTQYLEEADQLADSIAVIDRGRVVARGTAGQLKQRVGGRRLSLTVAHDHHVPTVCAVLEELGPHHPRRADRGRTVSVATDDGEGLLARTLYRFAELGVTVDDVTLSPPTLDDVFLALTGGTATPPAASDTPRSPGRTKGAHAWRP
ncbi:ATP-binding cassette domain-containing protein [Streptomyces sp. BB1-1-1]|uniref:ATP-binding cassette domain-containing protein n=1 Tax=Streptomyces sp. BB1-1-1 TaxID=3074430 RepID=UPI0037DA6BBA